MPLTAATTLCLPTICDKYYERCINRYGVYAQTLSASSSSPPAELVQHSQRTHTHISSGSTMCRERERERKSNYTIAYRRVCLCDFFLFFRHSSHIVRSTLFRKGKQETALKTRSIGNKRMSPTSIYCYQRRTIQRCLFDITW